MEIQETSQEKINLEDFVPGGKEIMREISYETQLLRLEILLDKSRQAAASAA